MLSDGERNAGGVVRSGSPRAWEAAGDDDTGERIQRAPAEFRTPLDGKTALNASSWVVVVAVVAKTRRGRELWLWWPASWNSTRQCLNLYLQRKGERFPENCSFAHCSAQVWHKLSLSLRVVLLWCMNYWSVW